MGNPTAWILVSAALLALVGPARAGERAGSSAGIPARAAHALRSFASDAWYVACSPARLPRAGVVKPLAIVGVGVALYAVDQEITDGFHRSHENDFYRVPVDVGEGLEGLGYPGRTFPYYIGGTVVGMAFGLEPVQQVGLEILETQFISGGIRNLATLLIGRRREHEGFGPRKFEFDGGTSFPSGHTSSAFQIATILSEHVDRAPATAVLYAAALAVCMQRVDSRSHWPSDVYFSAIEGTLTARTVVRRNRGRREGETRAVLVMPAENGLALRWRF